MTSLPLESQFNRVLLLLQSSPIFPFPRRLYDVQVEEFHVLVDDIRRVLRPDGIFLSIDVVLEVLLEEGKDAKEIAPGSVR